MTGGAGCASPVRRGQVGGTDRELVGRNGCAGWYESPPPPAQYARSGARRAGGAGSLVSGGRERDESQIQVSPGWLRGQRDQPGH